jgi:hypothetical protein
MKLNRVNIFLKWAVEGFYWVRLWLQLRNSRSSAPLVYREICLKKANPIVKFIFKVGFL